MFSSGSTVFEYCQGKSLKPEESSKWQFNRRTHWYNFWKQKASITEKMAAVRMSKQRKEEYNCPFITFFLFTRDAVIPEMYWIVFPFTGNQWGRYFRKTAHHKLGWKLYYVDEYKPLSWLTYYKCKYWWSHCHIFYTLWHTSPTLYMFLLSLSPVIWNKNKFKWVCYYFKIKYTAASWIKMVSACLYWKVLQNLI